MSYPTNSPYLKPSQDTTALETTDPVTHKVTANLAMSATPATTTLEVLAPKDIDS